MPIEKSVYLISVRYSKMRPWLLRGVLYDFTDAEECARALAEFHKMDDAAPGCPEVLLQEKYGSGEEAFYVNLAVFHPSVGDPSVVVSFFYETQNVEGVS